MSADIHAVLVQWLTSLAAVFFIVDPFAATPTFLAITASYEHARRKQMAGRAAITCFVLLSVFATVGKYIFRIFGITLPAFKLAGGVLLSLVALDMLQARRSRTKETPEEHSDARATEDVGIIPMGIPMLAGPGALSTVMVLVGPREIMDRCCPRPGQHRADVGRSLCCAGKRRPCVNRSGRHWYPRSYAPDGTHSPGYCFSVPGQRACRYASHRSCPAAMNAIGCGNGNAHPVASP